MEFLHISVYYAILSLLIIKGIVLMVPHHTFTSALLITLVCIEAIFSTMRRVDEQSIYGNTNSLYYGLLTMVIQIGLDINFRDLPRFPIQYDPGFIGIQRN